MAEVVRIGIVGCGQWEILRSIRIFNKLNSEKTLLEVIGYFDDDAGKIGNKFGGYEVLEKIEALSDEKYQDIFVINNIRKDCETRKRIVEKLISLGAHFFPFAILPDVDTEKDNIILGEGIEINEYTYIGHDTYIGNHTAIAYNVSIAHENHIGDYSFIAPGAVLAGRVKLGEGVYVGAGAVVIPNIRIGEWSVIGAGSVVMTNVPPYCTVMGNPARIIHKKKKGG